MIRAMIKTPSTPPIDIAIMDNWGLDEWPGLLANCAEEAVASDCVGEAVGVCRERDVGAIMVSVVNLVPRGVGMLIEVGRVMSMEGGCVLMDGEGLMEVDGSMAMESVRVLMDGEGILMEAGGVMTMESVLVRVLMEGKGVLAEGRGGEGVTLLVEKGRPSPKGIFACSGIYVKRE